ncbi:MAG TPA: hypothetical protein VJN18_14735 [Polyangiaceae bacterium]|nr:hypothetical protein [Polyangiaceae bacterium]
MSVSSIGGWVKGDVKHALARLWQHSVGVMAYLVKESRKPAVTVVERARRQAERGDERRAMLILREECFAVESDAGLWVHYGLACVRARRHDEGFRALAHALWLRERARDEKRARVMRDIIAHLSGGGVLPLASRKAA